MTEQQCSETGHLLKALENISYERHQQFILNVLSNKEILLYPPFIVLKAAFSKFGQAKIE